MRWPRWRMMSTTARYLVSVAEGACYVAWRRCIGWLTTAAACWPACPLHEQSIIDRVRVAAAGAISVFAGTTRDNFEGGGAWQSGIACGVCLVAQQRAFVSLWGSTGKQVTSLEYEAYTSMALQQMWNLCKEMRERWSLEKIALVHRVGSCPVTETSVLMCVSAAHRKESIEAVTYAINTLKARIPIWKKVHKVAALQRNGLLRSHSAIRIPGDVRRRCRRSVEGKRGVSSISRRAAAEC